MILADITQWDSSYSRICKPTVYMYGHSVSYRCRTNQPDTQYLQHSLVFSQQAKKRMKHMKELHKGDAWSSSLLCGCCLGPSMKEIRDQLHVCCSCLSNCIWYNLSIYQSGLFLNHSLFWTFDSLQLSFSVSLLDWGIAGCKSCCSCQCEV
jgi:hypothetical protein